MPTTACWVGSTSGNATASRYYSLQSRISGQTAESAATLLVPTNCLVNKMYVVASAAPGDAKSWTVTLYKNTTATSMAGTITGASTTTGTNTTAVSCTTTGRSGSPDIISIYVTSSGTPAAAQLYWCVEYTPVTANESIIGTSGTSTLSTTTAQYLSIVPAVAMQTTSSTVRVFAPLAGTIKSLYVELGTAPGTDTSRTFTVTVNAADTNITTTISNTAIAGSDTSNTAAIAQGQSLEITSTMSGTPAASTVLISIVFLSGTADVFPLFTVSSSAYAVDGSSNYHGLSGRVAHNATESTAWVYVGSTMVFSIAFFYLSGTPGTGTSYTLTFRDDTANTALTGTISDLGRTSTVSQTVNVVAGSALSTNAVATNTPSAKVGFVSYAASIPISNAIFFGNDF